MESEHDTESEGHSVEALAHALAVIRERTDVPLIAAAEAGEAADVLFLGIVSDEKDISLREKELSFPGARTGRLEGYSHKPLMVCLAPAALEGNNERQRSLSQNRAADELYELAIKARTRGIQFVGTTPGAVPLFTGALYAALSGLDVRAPGGEGHSQ
jgi:hypothetical protein